MKKNKTLIGVLIAVGIVVFLAVAVFVYFIISDIKQEEKLQTEINDITTLMSKENIDYTEIDKRLNRTVTKGDCAKTEEAAKEYLKDVISEIKTITNYVDLYKNDLIGTVDKEEANINKEITQITDILNVYEEVLNFLVKNKSSWTIENEQIVFNTDEQVNEYNKLISKIG